MEPEDLEFSDILLILKVGLVCVGVRGGGMEASELWEGGGKGERGGGLFMLCSTRTTDTRRWGSREQRENQPSNNLSWSLFSEGLKLCASRALPILKLAGSSIFGGAKIFLILRFSLRFPEPK